MRNAPAANAAFHGLNGLDLRPRAGAAVRSSVKHGARILISDRWRLARIIPADIAFNSPLPEQLADVELRLAAMNSLARGGPFAWVYDFNTHMALRQVALALRWIRRFEEAE